MLSATPINNTLVDIRNQFKLIKKGAVDGFNESHGIKNIDYTFIYAQRAFNEWRESENPRIGEFIKKLPATFFKLTDSLTVARTRLMIEKQKTGLHFPKKKKPENIFVTPRQIGNFDSFEELFDHFPPLLSGYQPSFYIEQVKDIDLLHDERQRDHFLVKMLYILLVKRLESSWVSFHSTIQKVLKHHQNALDRINQYQRNKEEILDNSNQKNLFEDDEYEDIADDFTLGKKRLVKLKDIDDAGKLDGFKKDLKKDIESLDLLNKNLIRFKEEIEAEVKKQRNHKSRDEKLQSLIQKINEKRAKGENNNNQKVLIFSVYRDTAFYLFDQLKSRGFMNIAVVSGDKSRTDTSDVETKNFEPLLERFAPYTKLFKEKEWAFKPNSEKLDNQQKYSEWQEWIADNDPKTHEKLRQPIDILIATDTLSEGQNLQDCDMVINYDIHWNPVRIIQRMGRIDRIGSPNDTIFGINYWPSDNINSYLNLKGRVEERMAMMKLASSEVHMEFSDSFTEMATDQKFEDKLNERMIKQMQTSWDDIEDHESGLGFNNLSLEDYRQDLLDELKKDEKFYKKMPKGVYTGFQKDIKTHAENEIIALLGYPSRPSGAEDFLYQTYDLIYIDGSGDNLLFNQKEVLDALLLHKDKSRSVPSEIDRGEEAAIKKLIGSIKGWLHKQAVEEEILEDGSKKNKMSQAAKDLLNKLKKGDKDALHRIKQNIKIEDKFKIDNFDLIVWFLVN